MSASFDDSAQQFSQADWFMLLAMLLYKQGGSADLTAQDTLGPVGKSVQVTQTADGMHLELVDVPPDA